MSPLRAIFTATARRTAGLMLGWLLVSCCALAADNQIRPFIGATFGGGTTLINLDQAVGKPNLAIGVTAVMLGDVFGIDIDVADAPGFFESGDQRLVLGSRVTTLTGNVVIAAPRRRTEYSLRPYFVGGAGLMRVRIDDYFRVLPIAEIWPGMDLGAGVVGFLTNRVGIGWEFRRFQTIGGKSTDQGRSFGREQLSFWRATMALAYRY